MDLRRLVFHEQPHVIFPAFLTVSSFLSLQPTPSAIPIVVTLTALLLYSRLIFNSLHVFRHTLLAASTIAIGGTLARLPASIDALSSSGASVALLVTIQLLTSLLALLPVYIDNKTCTRLGGAWAQVALFPALWATLWYGISSISPIGRLSAWSSTEGGGFYSWATPFWGAIGYDWMVAAWAVVLSQGIAKWYIGGSGDDEEAEMPLTRPTNGHAHASTSRSSSSVTRSTGILAGLLVLCAIPSFVLSDLPLAPWDLETATPLGVGCVLPPTFKHHALTLDDYISESETITNRAKLILWPEGAVTFNSVAERNEAFAKIRAKIKGSYVGVSFEENFEPEEGWPKAGRRNGIAIVSQWSEEEPHLLYFKRNLVPFVESFPLRQSLTPPGIFNLELGPPKDRKKEWGGIRSIPLTASICLDFAHPYAFRELSTRPALILAPARTWDVSVGEAMWQQAKQRANELDSMVLWCDGGSGGVSGVGGRGHHDVSQVGEGSWVKVVPIQNPFNDHPSAYAQSGRAAIVLSWVLVFAGTLVHASLVTGKGFVQGFQERRRRITALQTAPEGNLLDI